MSAAELSTGLFIQSRHLRYVGPEILIFCFPYRPLLALLYFIFNFSEEKPVLCPRIPLIPGKENQEREIKAMKKKKT